MICLHFAAPGEGLHVHAHHKQHHDIHGMIPIPENPISVHTVDNILELATWCSIREDIGKGLCNGVGPDQL